ncbi:MAG: indole-3-glycerol phosphate synthase TrpC [Chloroflexota bacterium]|nr:indole-3-glycerol phosphate synthase TrpC [Chloroflexota bacterium]
MSREASSILEEIVAHKRQEVAAARERLPLAELERRLTGAPPVRPFAAALRRPGLALIAEVKAKSPSRGVLRPGLEPVSLATCYARAGAAAISVLTDEKYFAGSLDHLRQVRKALPEGPPLLRKDFIIDPYQVYEARGAGADAVLLIVAALEHRELKELLEVARAVGMDALVEVHHEAELEAALEAGADLVGINNRDLRTFRVDLETTARLRPMIPPGVTVVAESGIHTREDAARLAALGVDAILVGEALVTAPDPALKVRELSCLD